MSRKEFDDAATHERSKHLQRGLLVNAPLRWRFMHFRQEFFHRAAAITLAPEHVEKHAVRDG
ncbi:MAG TPA: hypothetical protein PK156_50900, partial [Polyangium sp.]|nr:hypothetical protein [Polyangium sp.]